jgi:hypothetical protein
MQLKMCIHRNTSSCCLNLNAFVHNVIQCCMTGTIYFIMYSNIYFLKVTPLRCLWIRSDVRKISEIIIQFVDNIIYNIQCIINVNRLRQLVYNQHFDKKIQTGKKSELGRVKLVLNFRDYLSIFFREWQFSWIYPP